MITIGRDPKSTIVIGESYDTVSNEHAEIVQQDGEIRFRDHSANGTIINGQKIQGKMVSIFPGDRILLAGTYELRWEDISRFIQPAGRPTVARNIRPNVQQEEYGQEVRVSSRPTELYNSQSGSGYQQDRYTPTQVMGYTQNLSTFIPEEHFADAKKSRVSSSQIDREVDKWNWGAFFFGWIWGVFNKVYLSLIQLVVFVLGMVTVLLGMGVISPLFTLTGLGISIWLGVKGSRMAWDNGAYRNLEHFRSSRHNWNVAALIVFGVWVLLVIISLLLFVDVIMRIF